MKKPCSLSRMKKKEKGATNTMIFKLEYAGYQWYSETKSCSAQILFGAATTTRIGPGWPWGWSHPVQEDLHSGLTGAEQDQLVPWSLNSSTSRTGCGEKSRRR